MMKRYSGKNWNALLLACILGLGYAGYMIYQKQGGQTASGLWGFGFTALFVLVLLMVVARYFRDRRRR